MKENKEKKLLPTNKLYTINEYGHSDSYIVDLREVVSIGTSIDVEGIGFYLLVCFKNNSMGKVRFASEKNLQEEFKDIRSAWEEVVNESKS